MNILNVHFVLVMFSFITRCLRYFMQHASQQLQELASPSFKTKVVISLLDCKHIELETTTWLLQCTCTHIVGRTKEKENNLIQCWNSCKATYYNTSGPSSPPTSLYVKFHGNRATRSCQQYLGMVKYTATL